MTRPQSKIELSPEALLPIELDGQALTIDQLAAVARDNAPVAVSQDGRERAESAYNTLHRLLSSGKEVYGQTTGVGFKKNEKVSQAAADEHGLNILRSHATGAGPEVPPEQARAMMTVRLNQLAAGGSGASPELLDVLTQALNNGLTPPIKRYGAIGTADLTDLATTALC